MALFRFLFNDLILLMLLHKAVGVAKTYAKKYHVYYNLDSERIDNPHVRISNCMAAHDYLRNTRQTDKYL